MLHQSPERRAAKEKQDATVVETSGKTFESRRAAERQAEWKYVPSSVWVGGGSSLRPVVTVRSKFKLGKALEFTLSKD